MIDVEPYCYFPLGHAPVRRFAIVSADQGPFFVCERHEGSIARKEGKCCGLQGIQQRFRKLATILFRSS